MKKFENASLKTYNTFGIFQKAKSIIHYNSVAELQNIIKSGYLHHTKYLHIGGGSNLLFLNDFEGVILFSEIKGITVFSENENEIFLKIGAGEIWDDVVAYAVENGWGGIENLSLIPGQAGAAAIQNIGAYGVEICNTIENVEAMHLATGEIQRFTVQECAYAYRKSIFKEELSGEYAILFIELRLQKKPEFNLKYQHLEDEVRKNGELNLANIRKTIIAIREAKLPDPQKVGNAGSYFMNPVVPKNKFEELQKIYPEMPHYFVSNSEEKIPAAWLIDQCGWKGKTVGNAGVHENQALVLVNKGNACGKDILELAQMIQTSVLEKFGIQLQPEVIYIS